MAADTRLERVSSGCAAGERSHLAPCGEQPRCDAATGEAERARDEVELQSRAAAAVATPIARARGSTELS